MNKYYVLVDGRGIVKKVMGSSMYDLLEGIGSLTFMESNVRGDSHWLEWLHKQSEHL